MALATILAASRAYSIEAAIWGIAILGLLLMIIFGLGRFLIFHEKSRYFWLVLIITGVFYGLSHFWLWVHWPEKIRYNDWHVIYVEFGFSWGLGLVAIIAGLIMKWLSDRRNVNVSEKREMNDEKETSL